MSRLEPECVITVLNGAVTADAFLAGVAAGIRRHPQAATRGGATAEAVAAADRAELPWFQRLALLREHVLDRVLLLLVLENFDENLCLEAGTCTVRDPSLIELLASWADPPHRGRLLIICRHRFAVPNAAAPRLRFRHLGPRRAPARNPGLAVMARDQAAVWIASQVGGDMIVACDPAMCSVLLAHGVLAGNQLVLRPPTADPLGSAVVVATPAVRSQFGTRLASVYAPEVIASFGSGDARIDVRAVAPDGAAAFGRGLAADLAARAPLLLRQRRGLRRRRQLTSGPAGAPRRGLP